MIFKTLEILLILDFYSRITLNNLGYGYIQNFESNFGLKMILQISEFLFIQDFKNLRKKDKVFKN